MNHRDKKKRAKVIYEGLGSFICEPHEVDGMIADMDENSDTLRPSIEYVWMTDDEFNRLEDFQGF